MPQGIGQDSFSPGDFSRISIPFSMLLTDSISIGPLTVPLVLIIGIFTAAAAWLSGYILLRKDGKNRRIFSDILFSPILPFLLGWKLSLIITDSADVIANPVTLLYSSGGAINLLIGTAAACIWLVYRWKIKSRSREFNRAMAAALSTVLLIIIAFTVYARITSGDATQRTKLTPVDFSRENGSDWNVSEASGKVVVLNFWASWCPPCRAEMPMLERLQQDTVFKDVIFYAVNAQISEKNPDDGILWLQSSGIELPILFDSSGQGMNLYEITGLPTTIVLDRQGGIVERKTGAVSRTWLIDAVRKAER